MASSASSASMDWRRLLLLVLVAGLVSAGRHFIRLAILAAVGLAGLYMLHLLAQDYNKISNRPNRPAAVATRALFRALTKRHVATNQSQSLEEESLSSNQWSPVGHMLRQVLMQDPLGCARKLVCQLSASPRGPGSLRPHEAAILRLVREDGEDDEAAAEFRAAQSFGKSSKDPGRCALRYSKCRIEARTVLKLLLQSVG